jgi:hypothetical protein
MSVDGIYGKHMVRDPMFVVCIYTSILADSNKEQDENTYGCFSNCGTPNQWFLHLESPLFRDRF